MNKSIDLNLELQDGRHCLTHRATAAYLYWVNWYKQTYLLGLGSYVGLFLPMTSYVFVLSQMNEQLPKPLNKLAPNK